MSKKERDMCELEIDLKNFLNSDLNYDDRPGLKIAQ